MENYYEILGVDSTATQEEIQRRYRFLAMAFHPDRFGKPELREAAENDMKRINEAYDVRSDPKKREQYDMLLALYTWSELKHDHPFGDEPGEKSGSVPKEQEEKSNDKQQAQTKTGQGVYFGWCEKCQRIRPVKKLYFGYIMGFIVLGYGNVSSGHICAECAENLFWKYTAITLWLGWWGLRTFFMPIILIPANIINYIRAGELRKSSDQVSGIAVGWKLAIVTLFILIGYIFLPRMMQTQPNQPSASINAATATKTKVKVEDTVSNPTSVPSSNLPIDTSATQTDIVSWYRVSAANEGEYLCVYGTVDNTYWDRGKFNISFSEVDSDFHIVVQDGYYEDIEHKCVMACGIIKTYYSMPYIEVRDDLMKCLW